MLHLFILLRPSSNSARCHLIHEASILYSILISLSWPDVQNQHWLDCASYCSSGTLTSRRILPTMSQRDFLLQRRERNHVVAVVVRHTQKCESTPNECLAASALVHMRKNGASTSRGHSLAFSFAWIKEEYNKRCLSASVCI